MFELEWKHHMHLILGTWQLATSWQAGSVSRGLDEEACLLLGIAKVVRSCSTSWCSDRGVEYVSDLN